MPDNFFIIRSTAHFKFIAVGLDLINNFEDHIDPNDPTNNCLDVAIITAPEKRTQKTIDKLKTVAGRVLSK
jgi:5'-methylthioadenosine phosphorylase